MAIVVTERPNDGVEESAAGDGSLSYRAVRVFDVTDDTGVMPTYSAAKAALASEMDVDYGNPYDDDFDDLIAVSISPRKNKVAGMWTFTVNYSSDAGSENWTAQPPKIRIEPGYISYPIDYSPVDLTKYQNAAGTPFGDALTLEIPAFMVVLLLPRTEYDGATLLQYAGKLNATDLEIPGFGTIPARQARYHMPPLAEGVVTADNLWIEHRFEVRPGPRPGTSGWDRHVLNVGGELWYQPSFEDPDFGTVTLDPTRGLATFKAPGSPAVTSLLLDQSGKPTRNDTYMAADNNGQQYEVIEAPEIHRLPDSVFSPLISEGGLTSFGDSASGFGANEGAVVLSFKLFFEAELNDLINP